MFVIEDQRAQAQMRDQMEIDAIIKGLAASGYSPVLRSMAEAACQVASVSDNAFRVDQVIGERRPYMRGVTGPYIIGDLLFKGEQAYFLQLRSWLPSAAQLSRLQEECWMDGVYEECISFGEPPQNAPTASLQGVAHTRKRSLTLKHRITARGRHRAPGCLFRQSDETSHCAFRRLGR